MNAKEDTKDYPDIWQFCQNSRVYGDKRSAPIYRGYWRKLTVEGETSRSWVCNGDVKVPKRNADPQFFKFSLDEVENDCRISEHRYTLMRSLERVQDWDTFEKVANALGVDISFFPDLPEIAEK